MLFVCRMVKTRVPTIWQRAEIWSTSQSKICRHSWRITSMWSAKVKQQRKQASIRTCTQGEIQVITVTILPNSRTLLIRVWMTTSTNLSECFSQSLCACILIWSSKSSTWRPEYFWMRIKKNSWLTIDTRSQCWRQSQISSGSKIQKWPSTSKTSSSSRCRVTPTLC